MVHYLINFFKSTLTVPKIKDLVNTPTKKYESMYNILKNQKENSASKESDDYTLIDLLPSTNTAVEEEPNMKNELKNFLKKQLHEPKSDNILPLDSESSLF